MKYSFDDKNHIHLLDDKPLLGVTSVLNVISKPFLIQWSANMACEYVRDNLKDISELEEILSKAKTAHRKKKEAAGDWGTEIHAWIEAFVLSEINDTAPAPKLPDDKMKRKAVQNFLTWVTENKVKFLDSEKHVWSKELWIGGILDLVITMNGKKYIGDIKTSSGIYNEAFFQMGAYNICLNEMKQNGDIEGYVVINLKKDGTMETKMATDMKLNQDAFKYALGLYKIINSLKS